MSERQPNEENILEEIAGAYDLKQIHQACAFNLNDIAKRRGKKRTYPSSGSLFDHRRYFQRRRGEKGPSRAILINPYFSPSKGPEALKTEIIDLLSKYYPELIAFDPPFENSYYPGKTLQLMIIHKDDAREILEKERILYK